MALPNLPPPPKTDNLEMDRWMNLLYNNVNTLSKTNVVATINTTLASTVSPANGTDLTTTEALANDIKARLIALKIYT